MKVDESFGYALMAGFLILLGCLGVVIASQASEAMMQLFGLSLAGFAIFFTFFAIDRSYR